MHFRPLLRSFLCQLWTSGQSGVLFLDSNTERMVLVKKLIALALLAALLITTGIACTGSPTTAPKTGTEGTHK